MTKDEKAPDITSGVREGSVRDSSSVHNHHPGRNGGSGDGGEGSGHGQASGSRSSPTSAAMSSGFPAPAMVVPYVARNQSMALDVSAAANHQGPASSDDTGYWPPSPPSTAPSSPLASPILEQMRELSMLDDDAASEASAGAQTAAASATPASPSTAHRLLTQAAAGIAMTARDVPVSQRATKNQPDRAAPPHSTAVVMPATPEQTPTTMSPADAVVRHRPFEEASQFLHSLFPAFPADPTDVRCGRAEGSGVEIACPGWKGAVLDRSPQVMDGKAGAGGGGSQPDRTLYVAMPPSLSNVKLREDVLTTLDLASEKLACGYVVIALEHERMPDFPGTLHGLCYVGAQVVKAGVPPASERSGSDSVELRPREGIVLAAIEV